MLGLERQPEDVLLGQQPAQVVRVLGLLVDLGRPRRDPLLGDLADRVAKVEVLLGIVYSSASADIRAWILLIPSLRLP